jgi:hypothetical protein
VPWGQHRTGQQLSTDYPDAPDRLDVITDALAGLHDIVAAEMPLAAALQRIAANAVVIIPDADAVTVLSGPDGPETVAWTDARLLDIDKQQYAADRGPCLDAARSHRPVRSSTRDDREPWPEWRCRC